MSTFRFGVQLSKADSGAAWRSTARKVEDLGYSSLLVPDHFDEQFGPIVALTVAAEVTTTLRVGSLVFGNDYRHPVVLAKEMATLDLLSEGRVEFGMGAGWLTSDYQQSGIVADRPGVRIDRLAESLAIIKSMWTKGTATVEGRHYQVSAATGFPDVVQKPHPPIIIGGGGKRVLGLAAREADIVGVNPNLAAGYVGREVLESATGEYYKRRVEWVREAAGSRFDRLELQCLTFMVQIVPNRNEAVAQLASALSLTPEQVEGSPLAMIGTTDQIADILRQRREELGFSYIVVHEAEMEPFAAVVAELAGT